MPGQSRSRAEPHRPLGGRGRWRALRLAVLAGLLAACGTVEVSRLASDQERALASGRDFADRLVAEGRGAVPRSDEAVVSLGYLERLRLGLGSPFRLIDQALHDPRLVPATRERLAWALLARTLDRVSYELEAAALDRAHVPGVPARRGIGRFHLELIENAIAEAPDPRSGELAVRLAYGLAAAEGSVSSRAPELVVQAAALIRDREVARADAARLLQAARQNGAEAVRLVPLWRAERAFLVEAPLMAALPPDAERAALELAPRLAAGIRALGPRLAAGGLAPQPRAGAASLLSPATAGRLVELADSLDAPPQTPVVVAVDVNRRELLDAPGLGAAQRRANARFVEGAWNEERLAAEYALLGPRGGTAGIAPALATLWAAAALRAYGQEEVWFPGFPGPSNRELEDRYGLASVRFDADVPAAWRPYYRRMLDHAIADMQRVLPSLDLRGLRVHFGSPPGRPATLALHDPATRTVYLPPRSSAGTIAHEIAHDIDWQLALRRYRVRGDYGSDRAARYDGDRLAISLRDMSSGLLLAPGPSERVHHSRRPAEIFARGVDWFVVVSLAREGRTNGHLSSVQDAVLTGYGTVTPPDVTGAAGAALVRVLDDVAPVYPVTRQWFLESFGRSRDLNAYDLLRKVLEAGPTPDLPLARSATRRPTSPAGPQTFEALRQARDAAFGSIDGWICRAPTAPYDPSFEAARRGLVGLAAAARARGLGLDRAEEVAGAAGRRWLNRAYYGAPWPAEPLDGVEADLLALIEEEVRAFTPFAPPAVAGGFRLDVKPERCAAVAFPS
jgi:hypothetical protein